MPFIENLLCSRYLSSLFHLILKNADHFTDEDTEAPKALVTSPRSHSCKVTESKSELRVGEDKVLNFFSLNFILSLFVTNL